MKMAEALLFLKALFFYANVISESCQPSNSDLGKHVCFAAVESQLLFSKTFLQTWVIEISQIGRRRKKVLWPSGKLGFFDFNDDLAELPI